MSSENPFNRSIMSVCLLSVIAIVFCIGVNYFYKISQQKLVVATLRTVYAELLQASKYASITNGEDIDYYKTDVPINVFAEKYFTPYLNINHFCKGSQDACWKTPQYKDLQNKTYFDKALYNIILSSGAVVGLSKDKNNIVTLLIDTNGKALPNKLGRDVFILSIYNEENQAKICKEKEYEKFIIANGIHFGAIDKCGIPHDAYSYEELISQRFENGCNIKSLQSINGFGAGAACAAVLKLSSWTIDKNYPW